MNKNLQKRCSKCGLNFIGQTSWCKRCWKKYRDNLPKEEIQKINLRHYEARRIRRVEIRLKIFNYLKEHPCIVCGESDPVVLCFDHIDPSNKIMNVSIMISRMVRGWDYILNEINKCQVLCANCHARKTAKQQGWYQLLDKPIVPESERSRMGHHTRPPGKNKSSKFKGVSFHKKDQKWWALIVVNYKQIYLGRFDREKDAALAYNQAALKYFGLHSYLNKVED